VNAGEVYEPDTDELLSKAFMGYNANAKRPTLDSWPDFLVSINSKTDSSPGSGAGAGVRYALEIKSVQRANIPYREYLWQIPNPDVTQVSGEPYVCFWYGEAEWIHAAEDPTASDSYSFADYLDAVKTGTIKPLPCPGSS
jgi:hypothetical protein